MALDYDKMIEVKKKEYTKIKDSIPILLEERNKQIKDGNEVIFENKAKAEKIIADAVSEAERIVAEASKQKEEVKAANEVSDNRKAELDKRENSIVEATKTLAGKEDKLAQDKANFAKQQEEKLARAKAILEKTVELMEMFASHHKVISAKIAEISKI